MPPAIDAHCHLDHAFGGGWIERPAAALVEVLDAAGIERLVDLSGGWGTDALARHLDHLHGEAPDRFAVLGGIDWAAWPEAGAGFPAAAAASLRGQLRRGAAGLKVWKTLGLEAVDERGALVAIDDPRLDEVWHVCAEAAAPVVIHVGDPPEFFAPLDATNARHDELLAHPEWHWHARTRVSQDDLLVAFEALVARWPSVRFVGAHLLDLAHRPRELRRLLDEHPNLAVDLGARFPAIADLPTDLVACLAEHPDQVLYGLDHPPAADRYRETVDQTVAALERGLAIIDRRQDRDAVVDAVLRGNAERRFFPDLVR